MCQAQAVWLEPDRSKEVVPACRISGIGGVLAKKPTVKQDPTSVGLLKVNLVKEVKLVDLDPHVKGKGMAPDYIRVIQSMKLIPLDIAFVELFQRSPHLFPEAWKGDVTRRVYIAFAGTQVWVDGSTEPMIPIVWWSAGEMRTSYTPKGGHDTRSKLLFALFEGNYFAATDVQRVR